MNTGAGVPLSGLGGIYGLPIYYAEPFWYENLRKTAANIRSPGYDATSYLWLIILPLKSGPYFHLFKRRYEEQILISDKTGLYNHESRPDPYFRTGAVPPAGPGFFTLSFLLWRRIFLLKPSPGFRVLCRIQPNFPGASNPWLYYSVPEPIRRD